jgi:hypothetical protein
MNQGKSRIALAPALVYGTLFGQVAWGGENAGTGAQTPMHRSESTGDTTAGQKTKGYGTDGIAEEVDSYSLGNRSNLGTPDQAGNSDRFAELDSDADGFVSRREAQRLDEQRWREVDGNGDGKLDAAEFSALEGAAPEVE